MAHMVPQEGKDVHALRLHPSHHHHRHEHGAEAAHIAVAQPCLMMILVFCRRRILFRRVGEEDFRPHEEDCGIETSILFYSGSDMSRSWNCV